MTRRVGFPAEMDPFELDPGTAERLLTGAADASDAPPEYRAVARTMQALRYAPGSSELIGEPAAVERIAAAVVVRPRPRPTRRTRHVLRSRSRAACLAMAAAAVAVVSLTGGLASAGSLPEPAQNAASTVLGTVGISVPAGNNQPSGVDGPPPTTAAPVPSPGPTPAGASEPSGGAPPAVPPGPETGSGQGAVHGAPAPGVPPNNAKGRGNDHSPNGTPAHGVGNGQSR